MQPHLMVTKDSSYSNSTTHKECGLGYSTFFTSTTIMNMHTEDLFGQKLPMVSAQTLISFPRHTQDYILFYLMTEYNRFTVCLAVMIKHLLHYG